jgi:hypothetical protein
MKEVDAILENALDKIGGASAGHHHHHPHD